MINNQSLANAIFELTSVMPVRTEPHFSQKKEVAPEIRRAILRLESFLRYFSKMVTAPDAATLLVAVDKLQSQYRVMSEPPASVMAKSETTIDDPLVVDIVIPFRAGVSKHNEQELRFALRSIERHLQGYRNIIVVTNSPPEWLQKVTVISVSDDSRKNINLFRKRIAAAEASDADYNLYWCDDYVLLRDLRASMISALTCGRDMASYAGDKVWHQCLRATAAALNAHGKTALHCESHTPSLTDRKKFLELAEVFKVERETEPGLTVCGLYHNYYGSPMLPMDKFKATFENDAGGVEKVAAQCAGKIFLGYNDSGFESGVLEYLSQLFPTPSRFESL